MARHVLIVTDCSNKRTRDHAVKFSHFGNAFIYIDGDARILSLLPILDLTAFRALLRWQMLSACHLCNKKQNPMYRVWKVFS